MATSIGNKGGTAGSGLTVAVTLATVTAGSTIVVGVLINSSTSTITVADGQGSYVQCDVILRSSTIASLQCFYLKNANAGSHTIAATISVSDPETYIYAKEVIGAHLTAPLGTVAQGTGASGTALATAATLSGSSGDMILGFGGNEVLAETYTKGATFDLLDALTQLFSEHRALSGSVASFAANASQSGSDEWIMQGLTILQDPGGGGGGGTPSLDENGWNPMEPQTNPYVIQRWMPRRHERRHGSISLVNPQHIVGVHHGR